MLSKEERLTNLQAANARKTAAACQAVLAALNELVLSGTAVNINAVAETAGVSRGFIYSKAELRAQIMAASHISKGKVRSTSRLPNEASLTSRLETALDTIKDLKSENRNLKRRIENLTEQLLAKELAS